ncbi:MAG TPA: DUF3854 domain-containing protein [Pyrinomonadaceae bacterium]|jgi:hypothetical protein
MNLSEKHLEMLEIESAISAEVIQARGYRTVSDKKELAALGFAKSQQLTPGLLLPVYAPDGSNGLYQFRPNAPRADKKGKLIKYETPAGAAMRLDCPAICRASIKDPSIPLWITEGIKKGDSLASHGFCAVALLGVWNFKGENEFGGVTLLADFDYIALKNRKVRICFDSDIMQKPEVRKAMERLTEHLERKGAICSAVYLPETGAGKTGVDDFLAKHSPPELEKLVTLPKPAAMPAPPVFEFLEAPPETMRRPLSIIGGHAFAATWLFVKKIISESLDDNGNIIKHNPPKETFSREMFVMRDDGTLFGPGQKDSIESLGFEVSLSDAVPENRLLAAKAVTAFRNNYKPDAIDVFLKASNSYDHFLDFNRSLADQQTMCELSACFALSTWFLDAFNVTGFIYTTGGKGSGKSKHLNLTCELAYLGQFIGASGSFATLRDMADCGSFLGFDDAEAINRKDYDPDKKEILLSGNRRGHSISLKEAVPNSREWRIRRVQTYCARGFSAISLPFDTLADRSITFGLIRTANKKKADSEIADDNCWLFNKKELQQDLWLLALGNLTGLKSFDRLAASKASLHGRLLDTWRGTLAIALWLDSQDTSGVLKRARADGVIETLFERLNRLSVDYQQTRAELEKVDFTRLALRAVVHCILGSSCVEPFDLPALRSKGRQHKLLTDAIAAEAAKIIEAEEIEVDLAAKDENEFPKKLRTRLGRERVKLRFGKGRQGGSGKMLWEIDLTDLENLLTAFNLAKSEDVSNETVCTSHPSHPSHPSRSSHPSQNNGMQCEGCEEREGCEEHRESSAETERNVTNQTLFGSMPACGSVDDSPKCWQCFTPIPDGGDVCPNCERNQNDIPF